MDRSSRRLKKPRRAFLGPWPTLTSAAASKLAGASIERQEHPAGLPVGAWIGLQAFLQESRARIWHGPQTIRQLAEYLGRGLHEVRGLARLGGAWRVPPSAFWPRPPGQSFPRRAAHRAGSWPGSAGTGERPGPGPGAPASSGPRPTPPPPSPPTGTRISRAFGTRRSSPSCPIVCSGSARPPPWGWITWPWKRTGRPGSPSSTARRTRRAAGAVLFVGAPTVSRLRAWMSVRRDRVGSAVSPGPRRRGGGGRSVVHPGRSRHHQAPSRRRRFAGPVLRSLAARRVRSIAGRIRGQLG